MYLHGLDGAARDFSYFTIPAIYLRPDLAKELLRQQMRMTYADTNQISYAVQGFGMLEDAGLHYQPSDFDLSFLWALTEYLNASGDWEFLNDQNFLVSRRPFRMPHHTVSYAGLVGGGAILRPGEISFAHNGVLFLDELPEFRRDALEAMRQPLEDGSINISRASAALKYPAKFMLVAAMNPCPCGYAGDPGRHCTCAFARIAAYKKKISGPLIDRIDLTVSVPRVETSKLIETMAGEASSLVRVRVQTARNKQLARFAGQQIVCNSEMTPKMVTEFCELDEAGKKLLNLAMDRWQLSARAYTRILKLSRTIADLENEEKILPSHLAEALSYRGQEEKV